MAQQIQVTPEARRNAFAEAEHSLRLEGLQLSPLAKQLCNEVEAGRMTWDEYRKRIIEAG